MNKHIKNLLVAAGLLALGVTSANAANKNTVDATGTNFSATYNTDIRIVQGSIDGGVWTNNATPSFPRGMSVATNGNVLVATGSSGGRLFEFNKTTGATNQFYTANVGNDTRGIVQDSNGNYFYANGTDIRSLNNNDWSTATDAVSNAMDAQKVLAVGTKLFAALGADNQVVTRFDISGTTLSSPTDSTSTVSSRIRNMVYSSQHDRIYMVSSDNSISILNPNTMAVSSLSGLAPSGLGTEGLTIASFGGTDYLIAGTSASNAGSGGNLYALYVYNFTSATALGSFDRYRTTSAAGFGGGGSANVLNTLINNNQFTAAAFGDNQLYLGWNDGTVQAFNLSAVPEPSTYAMMAMGLVMTAYGLKISRRKKQLANKA